MGTEIATPEIALVTQDFTPVSLPAQIMTSSKNALDRIYLETIQCSPSISVTIHHSLSTYLSIKLI
jgi:hypothetical protein